MADNEITVTFHGATRKRNSHSGNPTWLLHTSEGDFRTKPDAAIGYEVQNATDSECDGRVGYIDGYIVGRRVVLTLTSPERHVSHWRLVPEDSGTGEEKTIEKYRTV